MDEQLRQRVSISPGTMAGKAVIHGTRVPVDLIVRMLAHGASEQEILDQYPRLETADIRAALAYAADVVSHEDVFPLVAPG
jgi:uncharacterized protein (DUF433 family)